MLIVLEDPGAANFILPIVPELVGRGLSTKLVAVPSLQNYLRERDVLFDNLPESWSQEEALDHYTPNIFLAGTAENRNSKVLAMISEARARGITTIAAVDGPANLEMRFKGSSKSPLTYAPDWLILPDEDIRQSYVSLGYCPERTFVSGYLQILGLLKDVRRFPIKDVPALRSSLVPDAAERKIVTFAAEVSDGLDSGEFQYSPEYTMAGWGTSQLRTEIVIEEFLDAVDFMRPKPYLVLRLHPKNTIDEFSRYTNHFDLVSGHGPTIGLSQVSDLMVGMTSIILLESAILKTPTLSILPRLCEERWVPGIQQRLVKKVTTREALRSVMNEICLSWDTLQSSNEVDEMFYEESLRKSVDFICERLGDHKGDISSEVLCG